MANVTATEKARENVVGRMEELVKEEISLLNELEKIDSESMAPTGMIKRLISWMSWFGKIYNTNFFSGDNRFYEGDGKWRDRKVSDSLNRFNGPWLKVESIIELADSIDMDLEEVCGATYKTIELALFKSLESLLKNIVQYTTKLNKTLAEKNDYSTLTNGAYKLFHKIRNLFEEYRGSLGPVSRELLKKIDQAYCLMFMVSDRYANLNDETMKEEKTKYIKSINLYLNEASKVEDLLFNIEGYNQLQIRTADHTGGHYYSGRYVNIDDFVTYNDPPVYQRVTWVVKMINPEEIKPSGADTYYY